MNHDMKFAHRIARHSHQYLMCCLTVFMFMVCAGTAQAVDIIQNFQGVSFNDVANLGIQLTPPDTMGAVGLNEYVEFVNGAFAVYSKTGTRQSIVRDTQFWNNAGISSMVTDPGLTDPRIAFDPTVNRWIATEINRTATSNQVLVARSDTSDPSGTWKAVSYTGVSGQFADYDTLNIDANNVYIGTNDFTSNVGSSSGVTMTVIPKSDILGTTPTLANMKQFSQSSYAMGWTPQGVTNYSSTPSTGTLFAVDAFNWNQSVLTPVNGSGLSTTLGSSVTINTAYDSSPGPFDPVQPGGTAVDVLDDRYSGTVMQAGDYIYATDTVIFGAKDAIHWLVVSQSTHAIIGEGVISDPNYNFFQPSLAVNNDGTFVIAFNRVGSSAGDGNISIYAAVGTTAGSTITVNNPFLLLAGTVSNFTGPAFDSGVAKRWGDYSSTTVDPTDSNIFWTVQEIPLTSTVWGTQIIAIAVPEPDSLVLVTVAAAVSAWSIARRKRR